MIIAVSYHLGWPQMTAEIIKDTIKSLEKSNSITPQVKIILIKKGEINREDSQKNTINAEM